MTVYSSIRAFYAARGGADSPEQDFGCWWTGAGAGRFVRYRVSVVHDTGDVYALDLVGGTVLLLGTFETQCERSQFLRHHGSRCAYERADAALEGWADTEPLALSWVRDRLSVAAVAS